jgi:hypothetical protein
VRSHLHRRRVEGRGVEQRAGELRGR